MTRRAWRGLIYYDRAGLPMPRDEWAPRLGNHAYCVVALDRVGRYRVSTVWVGLDLDGFGPRSGGPPLIFETKVFVGESLVDVWQDRYATEAEALAGHADMIRHCIANPDEKDPTE